MTLLIIFLTGTLAISFLCSILESVLMSTPISYITLREDEQNALGKTGKANIASLFKSYKLDNAKPIAAILSLNTIANTIGAAGVGRQSTILFGSEMFGIISAITTILILVFSEIIPKTIGTTYWRRLMFPACRIIRVLVIVLYPLVMLVQLLTRQIEPEEEEVAVSREEVAALADVGEDEGVIDEDENKIIQNVIKLDNVKASDVMTPRVVAATAPESMTLREFYDEEECSHFSRIPVYSDDPEYITGYILRTEALELLAEDHFDTTLGSIRRDLPFFSDQMSISDIWESLLKQKSQIGLIIDQYGCFQGILTMEDIIETIFGLEIIDEYDEVTDMQQYARERWQQRQKKFKTIQLPPAER